MMKSKFSLLFVISVVSFALTHFALAQNNGSGAAVHGKSPVKVKTVTEVQYGSFVVHDDSGSRQVYKNCEWRTPPVMVKGSEACAVKSKTDKNFCTGQIACDIHSEEGKKVYPSTRMDVFVSCSADGDICPSPGKCYEGHMDIVEKALFRTGKGEVKNAAQETIHQMIRDEVQNKAGNAQQ